METPVETPTMEPKPSSLQIFVENILGEDYVTWKSNLDPVNLVAATKWELEGPPLTNWG